MLLLGCKNNSGDKESRTKVLKNLSFGQASFPKQILPCQRGKGNFFSCWFVFCKQKGTHIEKAFGAVTTLNVLYSVQRPKLPQALLNKLMNTEAGFKGKKNAAGTEIH